MMEVVVQDRSLDAVFRREHPRLWRSLLAYTGDRDIASDAESEAFAQALRGRSRIDDPAAWIWRSAFRIAKGLMQKQRKVVLLDEMPDIGVSDSPVVEILAQLESLSEQQRAVVALRYVGELDVAQIAEALATSSGTVRVQLHRAHVSLRQTIQEDA